jgi:hypothetical protein
MPRDNDTIFKDADIFALTGLKQKPSFNLNAGWGIEYSTSESPAMESFNYLFYRLSALAKNINEYGSGLLWDTSILYKKGASVVGYDGKNYYAKEDNSQKNPQDSGSSAFWASFDVNNSDITSNSDYRESSGQVEIINGNNIQPLTSNIVPSESNPSPTQRFVYALPINLSNSPSTIYPIAEVNKTASSVFNSDEGTFLEYQSLGGNNKFELKLKWVKTSSSLDHKFNVNIVLRNASDTSDYSETNSFYVSEYLTNGETTMSFETTATSDSLSSPLGTGKGYYLESYIIGESGSRCNIQILSLTRRNRSNAFI